MRRTIWISVVERARSSPGEEDGQLRQPPRLSLLLRRRARHAGHDLDDVPLQGHGVPVGKKGAGQITVTSFSVPAGSLAFWRTRLAHRGFAITDIEAPIRRCDDRCRRYLGARFELVANKHDHRTPWTDEGWTRTSAIRGLHSVTMVVRDTAPTLDLMTDLLGYQVVEEAGQPCSRRGRARRRSREGDRHRPLARRRSAQERARHRPPCRDGDRDRRGAAAAASGTPQLRLQGDRGPRSLLLHVHLLPRAGRRALRGRDRRPRFPDRRRRRPISGAA